MRYGLDRSVVLGIALLSALIVGVAVSSYSNVLHIRNDAALASHSRDVIESVASVRSETRRLQAAQRAYLVNGLENALVSYREAEASLRASITRLTTLTEGDAEQSRRVAEAAKEIDSGVGSLNEMVALRREKGLDAVQAVGVARAGRSFIEPLLETLAAMEKTERDRLAQRDRETAEAYTRALSYSVAGAVVGLAGMALFVTMLSRHALARTRATARLAEQEELMSATLASIGDGVVATDKGGRVTFLNAVAEELTGWKLADAQGVALTEVFRIINETTRVPVENPAIRALKDGKIVGLANHTILIARDGTERPIDDSAAPIRVGGTVSGAVLVFRDISERKRTENEAREIRSRLDATLDAGEVATWTWDIKSDRVVADRNLVRLFGVAETDALGGPIANYIDSIHPDDRDQLNREIQHSIKTGDPIESRYRVRHADGTYRTVIARGRVERDEDGTPIRLPGVVLDISRQVESERELRESEERWRLALDAAELGAWNIDPATNALTSDDRFRSIFTGTTKPLTYEGAFACIHPDDQQKVRDGVAAATRPDDPAPYAAEYRVVHVDGTVRWVFAKGRANFEEVEGRRVLVSFDGTVMDVTDRVKADLALRAGEERLRTALSVARMVAWEWTPSDRKLRVSENAADVFGLPAGVGLTGIDQGLALVHPDDVEAYQETFRKAIRERSSYLTYYRLVRPSDKRVIWIEEQGHTVFDQPDDAVRLYGVATDITARREAEALVRIGEEKYRTLFETMDEGFVVIEVEFDDVGRAVDYRHIEANPAFERHTGIRGPLGVSVRESYPALEAFWYETYGRVAATGEPIRFEHQAVPLDGRWFEVSASRQGNSHRVAVVFSDITIRKEAEEGLRRLAADLSEAGRRKDEFLAILAHELRNPLAPIRNGLTVLRTAKENADLDRLVGMMDRQVNQLVHLVDDLLDVSRVTTGKVTLRPERVLLSTLVESAAETSRPLIEQGKHELTVSLPPEPVYVDADPTRFVQILTNLLNNAAKYTPPGGRIEVAAAREGGEAVVRVKDTGVGIPQELLAKVFDMFMQVGTSLERSQGGLYPFTDRQKGLMPQGGRSARSYSSKPGTPREAGY